jgi:hypothetical protein
VTPDKARRHKPRRRAARDPFVAAGLARWRNTRDAFEYHLEAVYAKADADCRGYLLNTRGLALGIHARTLFYGPRSRVDAYASDELLEWFRDNGRTTFEQYAAQHAGSW